jgi:Glycosyl hydrolases family 35
MARPARRGGRKRAIVSDPGLPEIGNAHPAGLRCISVRRSGRTSGNREPGCRPRAESPRFFARAQLTFISVITLLFFIPSAGNLALAAPQDASAANDLSGARIVQDQGWPELQVDGKPFFVHGAAFDYFGVPQDLWAHSLDRYREMGINTIDLTIPWNWHEPSEGEFDFDGHTNPRRDLRGLLRLIADRGFRLIVHAGPQMTATWRLAGYPEWLVRRPEYGMTAEQLADGAEPHMAEEFHRDAEAAAGEWLARQSFVRAREEWIAALARELAHYDSQKKISIHPPDTWGTSAAQDASGPLLFMVVGDDLGDRTARASTADAAQESGEANLARYVSEICAEFAAGGVNAPCLVSRGDLAESGLAVPSARSAAAGVAGQWIFSPTEEGAASAAPAGETLDAEDAETLALLADTLAEQSNIPALIAAFHAGGYAAPNEDSPARVAASATILGTRLLLGRGIGGIVYAPLQDSLTPASYEAPGTNRYLNRDVALDMEGNPRAQAAAVERNGRFVKLWGEQLASSHLRADLGVVDLRAEAAGDGTRSGGAERTLEQVLRVAELAGRTPEVLDPATQSVERLLRDPVLLLVAPKTGPGGERKLPENAQQALLEYVRRGGTLIAERAEPTLPGLSALWNASGSELRMEKGAAAIRRAYGDGTTIEWAQDFYSWVEPSESFGETRARPEAAEAIKELSRLMGDIGAPAAIHRSDAAAPDDSLVLSELVGHEAKGPNAPGASCAARPLCAAGLLSATNLDTTRAAEADLDILGPAEKDTGTYRGTLHLHVGVPAGESLLLPLHAPLCNGAAPEEKCSDEVITAGAELLGAEREKNVLELTFYAPMSAKAELRLESEPAKVELDEMSVNGQWSRPIHMLEVNVLRGAAPDYLRVLTIYLRYTPHVAEKPAPAKHPSSAFDVSVLNGARLPLGQGPALGSVPPLIFLSRDPEKEEKDERLLLRTNDRGEGAVNFEARLTGPFTGADSVRVNSGGTLFTAIKAAADPLTSAAWPPGGRLPGELSLTAGQQTLRIPLAFQAVDSDGTFHYTFDFERDGSTEWVFGGDALQVFLSPRDGGRMLALVSESSGENFTTTVGALRDWFLVDGETEPRDFTFNRAYSAEWIDAETPAAAASPVAATDAGGASTPAAPAGTIQSPGVRMRYDAREAGADGARIEKTVRLIAPATIEVRYRVSLNSESGISLSSDSLQFVTASSLAAESGEDRATEFCWVAADGKTDAACERFVPMGSPLEPPAGARQLEIRTPGHAALDFEWSSGAVRLVMKFDAVLLEVAVPLADGLPAETALRYTVGPVQ